MRFCARCPLALTTLLASLAALALPVTFALNAEANGKFPEAGQVVFNPSKPSQMAVRTTFGLLTTTDAGANWSFVCEAAMGYEDVEPPVAMTSSGKVIAALFEGASHSSEDWCRWTRAEGAISTLYVVDVSLRDATTPVAITYEAREKRTAYWIFDSAAKQWTASVAALPKGFVGLTLDVDPTEPKRVYVSGIAPDGEQGTLAVSEDAGATWVLRPITDSDKNSPPFIGGLHPVKGRTLYVRTATSPGKLLYTEDAGQTWKMVFEGAGTLRGFALSPDGEKILVGGEKDGVYRGNAKSFDFTKVSDFIPMCLKWTEQGIYACGHVFLSDGVAIAFSSDEGATFEPMLCLAKVEAVLSCEPDTEVGKSCGAQFEEVSKSLKDVPCGPQSPPASQSGSASSGASASGAGGTASTESGQPSVGSSDGACGVVARGRKGGLELGVALAFLTAAVGLARRGQRRRFTSQHRPD